MKKIKNNFVISVAIISMTVSIIGSWLPVLAREYFDNGYQEGFLKLFAIIFLLIVYFFIRELVRRVKSRKTIFVSYCECDREIADDIIEYLKSSPKLKHSNYQILSEQDIKLGEDIKASKGRLIARTGTAIVVISKDYLENEECVDELNTMAEERVKLIPFVLSSDSSLDDLPSLIKNRKGVIIGKSGIEELSVVMNMIVTDIVN